MSQAAAAVRSELRAAPQSPESTSQLGASFELGDSLLSAASALIRAAELSAQRVEALRGKLAGERQESGGDFIRERERAKRLPRQRGSKRSSLQRTPFRLRYMLQQQVIDLFIIVRW